MHKGVKFVKLTSDKSNTNYDYLERVLDAKYLTYLLEEVDKKPLATEHGLNQHSRLFKDRSLIAYGHRYFT